MCASLRRSSRAVTRFYEERMSGHGLTSTQFTLLRLLTAAGPMRQIDIGEALLMDITTLTRTLRPLEARGWLNCEAGEDRRVRNWSVTASGRRKIEAASVEWTTAQQALKSRLSVAEWEMLRELLSRVNEAAAA